MRALIASQRLLLDAIEAISNQPHGHDGDQIGVAGDSVFNRQIWDAQQRILERSSGKKAAGAPVPKPESALRPPSSRIGRPVKQSRIRRGPWSPEALSMEDGTEGSAIRGPAAGRLSPGAGASGSFEVVTSAEPVVISTDTVVDLASEPVEADEPVAQPEPEPTRKRPALIISTGR
jgi:hypothetical protein